MNLKTRKKYFNLCNPYKALEPDDKSNVDIDSFGKETDQRPRGIDWTQKFANAIVLSDDPVCKLFTGLPGSGKSTELKRLAKQLSDPEVGNFLPVFVNAEDLIDLSNPIDVTDIISSVMFAVESRVMEAKGEDPEKALEEGYHKRFWNWLQKTDVKFGKGEFKIPSAGKLVFEMKTRPTLRQQIRKTLAANFSRFIKEARDELILLREEAIKLKRDGIVVIFDSLEKLRGITENWDDVLRSAERVFRGNAPYVRLPVHVIYTVPAALTTRIKDVDFLPMIKVRDMDGNPHEPGMEAARRLVRCRVPEEALTEILGPESANRLDRLILATGGYPREIVQIMQSVIARTDYPVSEKTLDHITREIANEYRSIVQGDAFDWLASVAETRFLTIENDAHRRTADLMLQNHAVLRYLNDDLWFALHPAVREIPGVVEAIKNRKKGQNGGA